MKRCSMPPRQGWQEIVTAQGLRWHTDHNGLFWDESIAYAVSPAEFTALQRAAAELHELCLQAIRYVIKHAAWNSLAVDPRDVPLLLQSWHRGEPTLHGRFDFLLDETGQPKLLEYNSDTPTILLESAVIQREWLRDVQPGHSQWNDIEPLLVDAWRGSGAQRLHCSWVPGAAEEEGTALYLASTARMAGLEAEMMPLPCLGWDAQRRAFVDREGRLITHCYKLHPWEWMLRDPFARHLLETNCQFIEPPWKHLLSNKALLALLWKLFPDHPALLPCVLDAPLAGLSSVRKPVHGREGCNITIRHEGDIIATTSGPYAGRFVEQRFVNAPRHDEFLPLLCVWMIEGKPAGLGIREEHGWVTRNHSRFTPHFIAHEF